MVQATSGASGGLESSRGATRAVRRVRKSRGGARCCTLIELVDNIEAVAQGQRGSLDAERARRKMPVERALKEDVLR